MDNLPLSLKNVQFVCDNATIGLYSAAASLQTNGNLLLSPLSIVYAAVLLYLGAGGNTKSNLDSALHFNEYFRSDRDNVTSAFSDALTMLKVSSFDASVQTKNASVNEHSDDRSFQLSIANGIFVEKSFNLSQDYLSNATRYLRAAVVPEPFLTDAQAARDDINNWVDSRTGGKIKNLIPTGGVDISTKAVLVNAVYFKSRWLTVFPHGSTRKSDFHLLSGKTTTAHCMHLTMPLTYTENKELDFQYLELPYADFEASLLLFLPRKVNGLRQLENALTPDLLRDLFARADDSQTIEVSLPKFKTESAFDLVTLLRKIGVNDAFTSDADLSGIAPDADLQVSSAFHKTFIDLNEKGTEAAAASAVVIATKMGLMVPNPVDPVVFKADHPFIYAIRHNPTKLIVFIGRIESV